MHFLDVLPLFAALFALPQFLPQIRKLVRDGDASGVSPLWSALTGVNNAAWIVYFLDVGYTTAIVPNASVVAMSAVLTVLIVRSSQTAIPIVVGAGGWALLVSTITMVWGTEGLRGVLAAAFAVQVIPSLWAAYTIKVPTGLSIGTWRLVLCEMTCWLTFGIGHADTTLTILGITGVTASAAMVRRAWSTAAALRQLGPEPTSAIAFPDAALTS